MGLCFFDLHMKPGGAGFQRDLLRFLLEHENIFPGADLLELPGPNGDRNLTKVGGTQEIHESARLADAAANR